MELHLYQKEQLKKAVAKGFKERKEEYKSIQNELQDVQSHSLST